MPEFSHEPKIAIVIPVYNHGATLRGVVERSLKVNSAVVVVDDGSTDGGADGMTLPGVTVLRLPTNQGKGAAVLAGAKMATAQGFTHIVTVDSDAQHNPEDFPKFAEMIRSSPMSIIVGSRVFSGPNVPFSSRFGRSFSNFWLRVQTGVSLGDVQCGFRAYPLAVLEKLQLREKRYSFEVEVLVKTAWAGFTILETDVSVNYPPRSERISHFRSIYDNVLISLLNTRLTMRAILPVPHKKFARDGQGRISVLSPLKSLRMMLAAGETPKILAMSVFLGVFLGTLPLIGLHSILILLLAGYFRLNKIASLASSQLCIPPFVPALCIETGYFFLNGRFLTEINLNTLGYQALDRAWEWILGSIFLSPLLSAIMAVPVYTAAIFVRNSLAGRTIGQGSAP